MHYLFIIRLIAFLLLFLAGGMFLPLLVSIYYGDTSTKAFFYSILIIFITSLFLILLTLKDHGNHLNHRDGALIVTIGWMMAGLAGTLPYLFSGVIPDFSNAYFESISGFTTTGSSILNQIEGLPPGILLWRSITQWMGGMGIIVLSIAILPYLGIGGMQLYKAEIPSPIVDKLKPRISETAKILWKIYLFFTLFEAALLIFAGMTVFDAFCHAFSTMPTGGFSTKNASLAHYDSALMDGIIIIFMLIAGINFSLHYKLIKGNIKSVGKDLELKLFLIIVLAFTLIITLNIYGPLYSSFSRALRDAFFQVSSLITTTGFISADYEKWPALSQMILVLCMFLGGMAGSTGGGIKIIRIILLIKHGYNEIFHVIHPHAVTVVKLGKNVVPQDVLMSIWGFFILYLLLFFIASLLMAFIGLDLVSAFSAVASCLGNIGPGLGLVGPVSNFHEVPVAGKWILVFCMLLGRLEIYTVIITLIPEFWRK